jgi:tripartite-type tricarboxylate transporter receptor subunit TctC
MTLRLISRRSVLACALVTGFALTAVAARAQDAEEAFYKGKTVRLVVGYGAGGGYDVYARMIAPYIGKALGANVIVENQPGAGGITALNKTTINPPDGLQIQIVNGLGAVLAQLIGQAGVRYDLAKVTHLGTVSASPWMWLVGKDSYIKTSHDALAAKKKVMWAAGGPMDGLSDGAAFACEGLKLECGIVLGYPGSNDAALAVGKGEMDSLYVSDTSANNYVKGGLMRAIAAMGRKRSQFFPDVPTIFELEKLPPDQAWAFDFHSTVEDLGRILVAPPAIPASRLAFLQNAIKTALTNPELVAEGQKSQRYVDFVDADTTRKAVVKVVSDITPDDKKKVIRILALTAK